MPASARFGDVYHSSSGALAQARHVFLQGCGLPLAWAGQHHHVVCETGFGLGLNFLATWAAWRADPHRCGQLHFMSVEAWPVAAADLRRAAAREPELAALGEELAAAYPAEPAPGLHRISLDRGRVLLTLFLGEVVPALRQLSGVVDSVYLDGFSPSRNPQMWEPQVFKAVARLCRAGARAASWTVAAAVRKALGEAGFIVDTRPGLPPKRDALTARYEPRWPVAAHEPPARRHALIIGAGLAGAAAAASLGRRGWTVDMVCAGAGPADGASGLPVGLLAAHITARPTPMSLLSATGVALTLAELHRLLAPGDDWEPTLIDSFSDGVCTATQPGAQVRPAALVQAWLDELQASGRLRLQTGQKVHLLLPPNDPGLTDWQALDSAGRLIAQAPVCIVAAAGASATWKALPEAIRGSLMNVKGQFSLGPLHGGPDALQPRRGDGVFVPRFMHQGVACWGAGATYERHATDRDVTAAAHQANLAGLTRLCPAAADRFRQQLEQADEALRPQGWSAVRCASTDRLPLVGPVPDAGAGVSAPDKPQDTSQDTPPDAPPNAASGRGPSRRAQAGALQSTRGLHMLTALGSRGLSLAALSGELLAARIEGEPWPVERSLGLALDPGRWALRAMRRQGTGR